MQASVGDALNIGASVVTIAGALVSVIGFVRKLATPQAATPQSVPAPAGPTQRPGYPPPAAYPPPQHPQSVYPQSGYPPQPGHAPQPAYPPPQYPQYPQPGYAPAAGNPLAGAASVATAPRRRIPHPLILAATALAMLCVVIYSVVVLTQHGQTISTHNPLIFVTGTTVAVNLLAGSAAVIGLLVVAVRESRWGWFGFGIVGLLIMLFTVGIFSIAALAPTFFFALYDRPRVPAR
jgi:hypothetical protein